MFKMIAKLCLLVVLALSTAALASSPNLIITQDNKIISYADDGQGKTLIFIHAFPTDQQLWAPQQALAEKFHVITLDLWGFGQSSSSSDGQAMTMTAYADEIKQLMDELNIQKAIIGGESMGGYVALAFLKKYPNQVEGLILSDTQAIADDAAAKTKRETTAADIMNHGLSNYVKIFMPRAVSTHASEQTRLFLQNILENQKPSSCASALRGMALRDDSSQLLSQTKLPILILTGNQDTLILPKESKIMHKLAKNSKLVVIKNAGHLSNLEQPKVWNEAVIDMFNPPVKKQVNKKEMKPGKKFVNKHGKKLVQKQRKVVS